MEQRTNEQIKNKLRHLIGFSKKEYLVVEKVLERKKVSQLLEEAQELPITKESIEKLRALRFILKEWGERNG